jgi:hypothetical protein
MNPILCSIVCPSRNGPDKAIKMIQSIADAADDPQRIEFVIRLHDNETWHLRAIPEIVAAAPHVRIAVGPTLRGYVDLNKFFDEAIALSTGKWIWQMNDDAVVDGKGWDTRLAENDDGPIILIPQFHQLNESLYENDMGSPFPICLRCAITGPLPWPPDTGLTLLLQTQGFQAGFLPGVKTHHQRDVTEAVTAQREADWRARA